VTGKTLRRLQYSLEGYKVYRAGHKVEIHQTDETDIQISLFIRKIQIYFSAISLYI